MAHLTDNFTSETPLSDQVLGAISAAFAQGWADPKKLSQASHQAQNLRNSAIEEFASLLALSPAAIEVLGEPDLLHHLALLGYLTPDSHLVTSTVDVGKIRAVARSHSGPATTLRVDRAGAFAFTELPQNLSPKDLISLQAENGESGVRQDLELWRNLPARVALDGTHTIPTANLTEGFSVATFDAKSWQGPAGLGFLVINDAANFRYPLAHIAPIRTPGSYSLPLLVGAVIALSEYREKETAIYALRKRLVELLKAIDGVSLIGEADLDSRYLSVVIERLSGEELLRALLTEGISLDSGSACSAEDLTPSHVIAAMGYPTSGHLRMTIHATSTAEEIEKLAHAIGNTLERLSS